MNSEYGLQRESELYRLEYIYTQRKKGRIACLHSKKAVGNNNRLITLLTWKGLGTARTKRSSHIFH